MSVLVAVYGGLINRGITQPITVDEAYIYYRYIQGHPWSGIFKPPYLSSNHVLQTLLSYLTVRIFGVSEVVLRLPTLISALFYFIAAWRIAFLCFPPIGLAMLALGFMTLNPLVLDHLVLARGYGMALTFFAWSVYFSLRYQRDHEPGTLIPAGALLGLSASANLTFALPGAALTLITLMSIRRLPHAVRYVGSAVLCAGVILALPLSVAHRSDFYFGKATAEDSIVDLSLMSVFYSGRLEVFPDWNEQYFHLLQTVSSWGVPVLLLTIALVLGFSWRTSPVLRVFGGVLLISVVSLVIGHHTIDLKYPYDRTGLYLLVFFPLAFVAAVDTLSTRGGTMRLATKPAIVLASAGLLIYFLEIHTGYFVEWRYAADFKDYLRTINARSPGKTVRIGGSSDFWYLTNFYHDMHLCDCEETIDQDSRKAGYDYYVLLPDDRQYVAQLGLSVLQDTGQSILAAPVGIKPAQ